MHLLYNYGIAAHAHVKFSCVILKTDFVLKSVKFH